MFTGLIEEVGRVQSIKSHGETMKLSVGASKVLTDVAIGDSIAVNGVCLTVTAFQVNMFTADVMPETFRKSALHQLTIGATVNLERAMQVGARFGGHIVQGHVDGIGEIRKRHIDGNAVVFEIKLLAMEQMKYIIPKGSITVDGISLTVVDTVSDGFSVSIIPHTLAQTALEHRKPGSIVNIECDLIGKYVEHLLNYKQHEQVNTQQSKLNYQYLAEHGFM